MNHIDTMKLALEALEENMQDNVRGQWTKMDNACTALRQAIADAEQAQPAAVVSAVTKPGADGVRVRWMGGFPQIGDRLYHAPPPRKALTDEEIDKLCPQFEDPMRCEMWIIGFKAAYGIKEGGAA